MLYEHDGEPRTSNGEYVSDSEALQNAIEWGMVPVEPDYEAAWKVKTDGLGRPLYPMELVREIVDAALKGDT